MKDMNNFTMLQALLVIQNILQDSDTFNRSRETVHFAAFCDKKVTQFSGFLPTSVSYIKLLEVTAKNLELQLQLLNKSLRYFRVYPELHRN